MRSRTDGRPGALHCDLSFFPAFALVSLRLRRKNAFVELETHPNKDSAARHVLTRQIPVAETHQVVANGEPHVADQLIACLSAHAVLAGGKSNAVQIAGGNSEVPFPADVPGGAAPNQLCGSAAGEPGHSGTTAGNIPLHCIPRG